jgi:hypothetical protein
MQRTRVVSPLIAAALLAVVTACSSDSEPAETNETVATADSAMPMEETRAVAGGGISVPGWAGRIDASEATNGQVLENARLAPEGDGMRVTTGPAVAYWNPSNMATGNYTVSATFNEPQFMNLNDHPHPYGVFVAGNSLGTDQQTYLYCAAYGNGNFIVRGFGPAAFQLNGPRGGPHDAVNRAASQGQPVTQQIAITVAADRVDCSINGQVVATYPRSEVVTAGRLQSTDGIYGIRFAHNTDGIVTDLEMTPN